MTNYPCPSCGKPLTWVQQYNQWYCYTCQKYIPPVQEQQQVQQQAQQFVPVQQSPTQQRPQQNAGGTPTCPKCGQIPQYVQQYGRWYCYSCKEYLPVSGQSQQHAHQQVAPQPTQQASQPRAQQQPIYNCPTCQRPIRYIQQYQRWYCDNCRKYI